MTNPIVILSYGLMLAWTAGQIRWPHLRSSAREHGVYAACYAIAALVDVTRLHMSLYVLDGILGAAEVWLAWKQRKPRQRKPSKLAAKVRDLGHRLAVIPA